MKVLKVLIGGVVCVGSIWGAAWLIVSMQDNPLVILLGMIIGGLAFLGVIFGGRIMIINS